jgi:hypothetical protein
MLRFQKIDPPQCPFLEADDYCAYLGEYTAGGGWQASETNRRIHNLHKRPGSSPHELWHKGQAVEYWGRCLAEALSSLDLSHTSFVAFPCSKPVGHDEYDNRMDRVLDAAKRRLPAIDIRQALIQKQIRESQHTSSRASPEEIAACLAFNPRCLPLRPNICIVDDVITRGASFAAAKILLLNKHGVRRVAGLMLAKTVRPAIDFSGLFIDDDD